MRILLANKFYYPRGGDCVYTIGLESLLKDAGHEVAIFAMQYPGTLPTPWERFFPSEVSFSLKKPLKFLKALVRPLYSFEVARKFNALLDEFKPDVLHLNNVHTQLSPLLAKLAKKRGVRVVWTLHDYKLLCPRYDCVRDGRPCELCFGNDKRPVLKYSCLKGSRLASVIAMLEAWVWGLRRLETNTDIFICPSAFMKRKMEQGGFNPGKLQVIHNFIDSCKVDGARADKHNHYCYVGRLIDEKGIRTLLEVAATMPYGLKVIGTGPLESNLRVQYKDSSQIEFLGHQNWDVIREIVGSARFMVVPSEWYENCPLTILEAHALGTYVLGADIGGIPELIDDMVNGQLFPSGNSNELSRSIQELFGRELPDVHSSSRLPDYLEKVVGVYSGGDAC